MKKKKWLWIGLGAALILILVIVNIAAQGGRKGVPVQLARVRTEDITSRVRAPGKIEPKTQVKISADIMGKVTHLAVKEGDRVKKGQLLLQIDAIQRTADKVQAQTALASAHSRQRDADAKLKVTEANHQRQKALFEQKLLSQAEWDQATSVYDAAREAATSAREDVARAEAALTAASDQLAKTRIVAPIDGVVSALYIEEGEIVMKANVDETDVPDVRLGEKAKISVDAIPDTSFDGTVTEIGNTAKRSDTGVAVEGQTNFEVEVTFDSNVPQVRPGMTADVEIETATHPRTNGVPIQAVVVRTERELERAKKKGVRERRERRSDAIAAEEDTVGRKDKEITGIFVVRNGMAKFVAVKTGIASETMIEIAGGVKPGESVVTGPYKALRELKPEQKVRQEQPGAAKAKG
ncbi:MAG: efflux RND transporter periplasmic adaptor subunit [Candidatus Eisenbacteria bacterium]|uniref:Efflux RND transporter periplasmic adaptor subunit n=1 Tax=Eiseniibacteriota bacterium TaxID=2212470 RepID=A0A538U2P1_UNCEI|nr:MAG: efflux RND transporter periplasmic adaptor subunit [Candidatus Eisenbacteria bacterium]